MAEADTITKSDIKLKTPSLWKVILHNDDFTPFDFVIQLLMTVFHKSFDEASSLASHVHNSGRAAVGVYTKEVAETKVEICRDLAEQNEHPLLITTEEA